MGSASGGSDRSSSSGKTTAGTINPIVGLMQQMFGLNPQVNQRGQLRLPKGGQLPDFFGGGGAFAPDTFAGLGNIFDPIDSGARFDLPQMRDLAAGGLGTIGEAAETGLIDPAIDLGRQIFGDFMADSAERFGTEFGLGSGDSDFGAILAREAQRQSTELANLAQDRRLAAATGLPSAIGSTAGLETLFEGLTRQRTPGEQQLNQLLRLAGINTQPVGTQQTSSSSKGGQGSLTIDPSMMPT